MNTIWVTFQRKGFHKYPGAPEQVAYLQTEHRHLFKFKVSIEVEHQDRAIEFHMFLNWVETLYEATLSLDYKSCEMICDDLASQIMAKYPDRYVQIDVSEDGECGATCEYNENRKYQNRSIATTSIGNPIIGLSFARQVDVFNTEVVNAGLPKMQAIRVEPQQTVPVEIVQTRVLNPSHTQLHLEQTGIPAYSATDPAIERKTLANLDLLIGSTTQTVTTIPVAGIMQNSVQFVPGQNAAGIYVKHENNMYYSSSDNLSWEIAQPDLDIVIVTPVILNKLNPIY